MGDEKEMGIWEYEEYGQYGKYGDKADSQRFDRRPNIVVRDSALDAVRYVIPRTRILQAFEICK